MSGFERPEMFWLLLALAPLAVLEALGSLRASRAVEAVWGIGRDHARSEWARIAARLLAAACLVLVAAGPRAGARILRGAGPGLDLAIAVDVSRSMLVQERGTARLDRAKALAREALAHQPLSRVALVAFKGAAVTVFPLSDDREPLLSYLDRLGPEALSDAGTDLGTALEECERVLSLPSPRARAVLLLSDGEDLGKSLLQRARGLKEKGISLLAVGIGSEAGARVPYTEGASAPTAPIVSRRDSRALAAAVAAAGGAYAGEEDARALDALWKTAARAESRGRSLSGPSRGAEFPFLAAAALAWIWSLSSSLGRLAGRPAAGAGGKDARGSNRSIAAILLCLLLSGCGRIGVSARVAYAASLASKGGEQEASAIFLSLIPRLPPADAAVARYDAGAAYLSLGEPGLAAELLERALEDLPRAYRASGHFDLGCARFALGEYRAAWESFKAAIKADPGFRDARVNLELAAERMKSQTSPAAAERAQVALRDSVPGDPEEFDLVRESESARYAPSRTEGQGGRNDY